MRMKSLQIKCGCLDSYEWKTIVKEAPTAADRFETYQASGEKLRILPVHERKLIGKTKS